MISIFGQSLNEGAYVSMAVVGTFMFAGFVKGVVGLGLPTIAMGMLALFMPPGQAAALLIAPSLVTNVWQMFAGRALGRMIRRLWSMQAAIVVGTIASPVSVATIDVRLGSAGLGAALVIYSVLGLRAKPLAISESVQQWVSPAVGFVTGAITAATGVFVFPAVPYLQAIALRREELLQALGLSFSISTIALFLRLAADGSFFDIQTQVTVGLTVPLVAALVGMAVGQKLRGRFSEPTFKRMFFLGLSLVGVHLLVKGFVV